MTASTLFQENSCFTNSSIFHKYENIKE